VDSLTAEFFESLAQTSAVPSGLVIRSAKGCWITDAEGGSYLDWLAGISVLNTGHCHPKVVSALVGQAQKYLHTMVYGEYVQESQVLLAAALKSLVPIGDARVFFTSSGAEAVEGALKLARKHTGRKGFAAFEGSYHGDTFGALAVTGSAGMRGPFEPLPGPVKFLPFGPTRDLGWIDRETAAVIVEPIQAEGGVVVPPGDFLPALRKRCDETGALLIADEIQTGLGRTGMPWGCSLSGVTPDVMVLAKAVGGGLPLGAFIAPAGIMKTLSENPPLSHLTTFGGHPLSCAAGLAALKVTLEENLQENASELGEIMIRTFSGLLKTGLVEGVSGKGLLIGVKMKSPAAAEGLVSRCRERGLLIGTALHDERVIRITPPLIMSDEEMVRGLEIFAAALADSGGR